MKIKWLDRRISAPGPYLCLCLTEEEFRAAFRHINTPSPSKWINHDHSGATTHLLTSDKGLGAVVCLTGYISRNPIEVAGLLVHEAVHVWQEYCRYYGETNPGTEQEAYAVQSIAQELMAEFSRRMK